ncbi:hypothetical protein [Xylophilus sp. GOD-11R]|uniref:hypothetical protein n=1 Tax=Xylophilus sp. GOD-11R TaxID=3089814 RepID=UPI00298C6E04|nr:hypothetical protein [Xylophilus sp. GOD-11R]WPB56382.1 hypothetical protein R9X41_19920 [Xylophilus sp. GOD-11R]
MSLPTSYFPCSSPSRWPSQSPPALSNAIGSRESQPANVESVNFPAFDSENTPADFDAVMTTASAPFVPGVSPQGICLAADIDRKVRIFNDQGCTLTDLMKHVTFCAARSPAPQDAVNCLARLACARNPLTGNPVPPDTMAFNAAMTVCGKAGRVDLVDQLHAAMVAANVEPDTVTYSNLIMAYTKAKKVGWSVAVLQYLLRHAQASGMEPETAIYRYVIAGCLRTGRVTQAVDLYFAMINHGITPSTEVEATMRPYLPA